MARYGITIAVALVVAGSAALFTFVPRTGDEIPDVSISVFWVIASVASAYILLSVWGMIGIWLSLLKKRATEFAAQDVVVSRRSWHYLLNTWMNAGKQPSDVISECEYWARLFHGLSTTPPIYVVLEVLFLFIAVIGWLLYGARLDFGSGWLNLESVKLFKQGRQPIGPIMFILMLAAGLTFSGAGSSITHAPWPTIGIWSGSVIGGIVGGVMVIVGIVLVAQNALRAARPLFSAAGARIIGICRPMRFVD